MNAKVLAGYLSSVELQKVFKQLERPGTLLILESLTDLQLQQIEMQQSGSAKEVDPAFYEEGRMFDEVFELRWQRLRGFPEHVPDFRAMLISDDASRFTNIDSSQWKSSAQLAEVMSLTDAGSEASFIWGEAVRDVDGLPTGAWYEKEVPRLFRYPVDNVGTASHVKLITKSYQLQGQAGTDDKSDVALLYRFSTLIPAKE